MDWKDRLNGMLTEKSGSRIPPEDKTPEAIAHRVKIRRALSRQRHQQGITSQQQKERAFKSGSTPHATVEARTDWKDRLKDLVLETVGRVRNYKTYTTPPKQSPQQQRQTAKANYQEWRRGQRRVGIKHIEHHRRQLQNDDY